MSLQAGRTFSLTRKWGKRRPDRARSGDLKLALSLHPLQPTLVSGTVLSSIMQRYSLPALIAAGFRVKKFSFEIIMPTSVHIKLYANAPQRSAVDGRALMQYPASSEPAALPTRVFILPFKDTHRRC